MKASGPRFAGLPGLFRFWNRCRLTIALKSRKVLRFRPRLLHRRHLSDAPPRSTPELQELPAEVQTWLIEPLKAPEFSLPDLDGNVQKLASLRDGYVLLTFWSTTAPRSLDQLKNLNQYSSTLSTSRLRILAINVDQADTMQAARSFVNQQHLSFPVVLATEEVAGIYNLIYRHLHDRRRDMPIPISFLVDRDGMIVKVYEGTAAPEGSAHGPQVCPRQPGSTHVESFAVSRPSGAGFFSAQRLHLRRGHVPARLFRPGGGVI